MPKYITPVDNKTAKVELTPQYVDNMVPNQRIDTLDGYHIWRHPIIHEWTIIRPDKTIVQVAIADDEYWVFVNMKEYALVYDMDAAFDLIF